MRCMMKSIRRFDNIEVTANVDMRVDMAREEAAQGVVLYRFDFRWDEEQAKDPASMVRIE